MTSVLLAILVGQAPPTLLRNDDAGLLRAVAESFFETDPGGTWRGREWTRGDLVVFGTQLLSKRRTTAIAALKAWTAPYEEREIPAKYADEVRKELAPVRALIGELAERAGSFTPPTVMPLKALDPGERAVVGDTVRGGRFGMWEDARLPGRPKMRPRVLLSVSPPAYSGDGVIAVVAGNAPWSIHSADLLFVVRREKDGRRRLFVKARYYA